MPATVKQKVEALRGLLGDDKLVADVLLAAGTSEKELLDLGVDFKELDAEEQPSEEAASENQDEDVAEETQEEPADETESTKQDEEEDSDEEAAAEETEEEGGEETQDVYLADVTVDEFADMLAGALDDVFGPYFDKLDEVAAGTTAAQHPAPVPAKKEAEVDEAELERLRQENEALTQELATLKEQKQALDEVISNLPKGLKARGYRASEDEKTVLKEDDPKIKLAPQGDSALAEFAKFVIGNPTNR